jgi:hypothetical protein
MAAGIPRHRGLRHRRAPDPDYRAGSSPPVSPVLGCRPVLVPPATLPAVTVAEAQASPCSNWWRGRVGGAVHAALAGPASGARAAPARVAALLAGFAQPDDVALLHTSGTAGPPKRVP